MEPQATGEAISPPTITMPVWESGAEAAAARARGKGPRRQNMRRVGGRGVPGPEGEAPRGTGGEHTTPRIRTRGL